MSCAKLVAVLAIATLALSACGSSSKPVAGSSAAATHGRGKVDDPRTTKNNRIKCLQQHDLPVTKTVLGGLPSLQIGTPPTGPTVMFTATPGIAQGAVIQGFSWAQGAEVIGSALLFPNHAPGDELKKVEDCLAQGVSG
jgi:hypothetical protein